MNRAPNKLGSDLPLHRVISERLDFIKRKHGKTQTDIAAACGYEKPAMVAMWKSGSARVPIDKVPALAAELELDPAYLMRLVMAQFWPADARVIAKVFGTILTTAEAELIETIRGQISEDDLPEFTRILSRKAKTLLRDG